MLVSGLGLMTLTVRSLSFEWMPSSWPSYTLSPSAANRRPRSCSGPSEYAGVVPAALAIITPLMLFALDPVSCGPSWSNTWNRRPDPLVRGLNSFVDPFEHQAGRIVPQATTH